MRVYKKITDTIGNTPIVELSNLEKAYGLKCRIFAKIESFNPAGSVKDRVAIKMIEDAEEKGLINKDTVIIEPTSGNTGIGLAMVGASKGLKVIIVMPDSMSVERRNLMKAYGAELVLTEGSKGMKGAIEKANELASSTPNSFIPSQFTNPANPKAHYDATGKEIWDDLDGQVDIFVSAVGTGGTISGTGKYLKEKNKNIKIIAVEPASSPVLSGGKPGPHKIQGIGAGFIPDTLDTSIYDVIYQIENEDAFRKGKMCAKEEGILIGISSGAALSAALLEAQKQKDKNIVVIFPDTGERYLSTSMFNEE